MLFSSLRRARFFALLLVLPLGLFAWGSLTGTRLLGDDNETTETLEAPGQHHGSSHARFYHK